MPVLGPGSSASAGHLSPAPASVMGKTLLCSPSKARCATSVFQAPWHYGAVQHQPVGVHIHGLK